MASIVSGLGLKAKQAIDLAQLAYINDDAPGITREPRRGKFVYRDSRGHLIRDSDVLSRIIALAIPPAWTKVWICPKANGHIQATGRDARGRKQYRYHAEWRCTRDAAKFEGLQEFGRALPKLRQRVERDLRGDGLARQKVLAAVVRLLDRSHLRVGNAEYVRTNKSHGLSTLFDKHVTFPEGAVRLKFRGKSGIWHDRTIDDARLARIVRACRDVPGEELFQYYDSEGVPRVISSADVNAYLREASGEHTAKTFRTWAGSVKALALFRKKPRPAPIAAAKRRVVEVIRQVAEHLGNTPAVCRKSYVHPRVIVAFLNQELTTLETVSAGKNLSADENRLLWLLQGATKECRKRTGK